MSNDVVLRFPDEMTYRKALLLTDALLIGDMADLTKEKPEYALLEDLKQFLTYKAEENEDGFLTGSDRKFVLDKLAKLGFGNVSNVDNVPDYRGRLSDLLGVGRVELNTLKYNCVYAGRDVPDFPPELKESDSGGFVFTNRNEDKGVQVLIGIDTSQITSRRKKSGKITNWSKPNRLINSYTSDLIDVAPTASALHQAYLSLVDKILKMDMIITGGDISVFPTESLIPAEGGSIEIIIKTSGEWTIKQV